MSKAKILFILCEMAFHLIELVLWLAQL